MAPRTSDWFYKSRTDSFRHVYYWKYSIWQTVCNRSRSDGSCQNGECWWVHPLLPQRIRHASWRKRRDDFWRTEATYRYCASPLEKSVHSHLGRSDFRSRCRIRETRSRCIGQGCRRANCSNRCSSPEHNPERRYDRSRLERNYCRGNSILQLLFLWCKFITSCSFLFKRWELTKTLWTNVDCTGTWSNSSSKIIRMELMEPKYQFVLNNSKLSLNWLLYNRTLFLKKKLLC